MSSVVMRLAQMAEGRKMSGSSRGVKEEGLRPRRGMMIAASPPETIFPNVTPRVSA
jgi:hypothetical protein